MGDVILFIFALVDSACSLFLAVYFVISLSDLECDYLNATECCEKLNWWVYPELSLQAALTTALLVTWHPLLFLFNVPLITLLVYRAIFIPKGQSCPYDPAEIHNRGQLKSHMKESLIKLGFHLVIFFVYLYCMIVALLQT